MKLLVFGKSGQVARELQRHGAVTALSRADADLTNPAACAEIIADTDADVVINAAAYTAVDHAEDEPELAELINATAPAAMARAAARRGIPFLHLSTDYVFDGKASGPYKPDAPTDPLGVYGRTKLAGETAVITAGGPYVVLRTSWVFSVHGSNFVKTMLRLGANRPTLDIVGDQIGGPTPATDIAKALFMIAQAFVKGDGRSGVFHFTGRPAVSWADFAREIFSLARLDVSVADIPSSAYITPARRPDNSQLDCASLMDAYGLEQPDWRIGLGAVIKELG